MCGPRALESAVCASLQGMPFEPCFHIEKTDERSFRGSWMGFAYCDFTRRDGAAANVEDYELVVPEMLAE